jgi:hypothetical protein
VNIEIVKSKTIQYTTKYNSYYFFSSKSNLDKRGLTKQRGQNIVLSNMSHCRSAYPELPNGRYYEYLIRDDRFLKGKQCKEFTLIDKKADHKQLVAVQVFESIPAKYIEPQVVCFNVKGGVVKFTDVGKTSRNQQTNSRISNEKFLKFIQSHRKMSNLDVPSFYYFTELYNKCQNLNIGIPYKAKDLICGVYNNHNDKELKSIASKKFVDYAKKEIEKLKS